MKGKTSYRASIETRALDEADFIIEKKTTVRQCAEAKFISKSTVHKDVTERLMSFNPIKATEVRKVLDTNKEERALRGGLATRQKYSEIRRLKSN